MPGKKHPEPFWRSERNCYFVQIGKKQHRLATDRDEAYRLYHELMSKPPEERTKPVTGDSPLAVEVIDAFLEWVKCNRAADTYDWYLRLTQLFAESIPEALPVAELKPYHITRVMDANSGKWNNNTKHDFSTALQRSFNWALKQGLIDKNPVAYVEKPGREAREMALSPAEYAEVMASVTEPNFRDLLALAWETGARVQELRKIEARFFDAGNGRLVFPPKEAKGKKYYRVVYLTDEARAIVQGLCNAHPTGAILRNSDGEPWHRNAINCAFSRLQITFGRQKLAELGISPTHPGRFKKGKLQGGPLADARAAHRKLLQKWRKEEARLAREHGKKYHLGAFRKGFTTEALKNGLDTVTVAHLLGHRDGTMVSRVYGRVQQDPEFMAVAARRARGGHLKAGGDA